MREDLPCDDPLPEMWSIRLTAQGDVVDASSTHESAHVRRYDILENLTTVEPHRRSWRVRGKDDGVGHILSEFRMDFIDSVAVSRLGLLRELMLREARLLDDFHHTCTVPLEDGWLEQRTGRPCSTIPPWGSDTSFNHDATTISRQSETTHSQATAGGGRWRSTAAGGFAAYNKRPLSGVVDANSLTLGVTSTSGEDPIEWLRQWVPSTVDEASGDSDQETTGGYERVVGVRPQWGGDDATDWIGTAEPKTSSPLPLEARVQERSMARRLDDLHGLHEPPNRSGHEAFSRKVISFASYILTPDWLPLAVWFNEEFEPRLSRAEDDADVRSIRRSEDWARVWRKMLGMYSEVVRAVEHVHVQGMIHNAVHPWSVWVTRGGGCRLGNVSQVTPPGHSRPLLGATAVQDFASPERLRGERLDSHSDVYSLGVLLLEFWRRYSLARGLWGGSAGDGGDAAGPSLGEMVASAARGESAQPAAGEGLLDLALVRSMLAEDAFDRPDCFEVLDGLGEG